MYAIHMYIIRSFYLLYILGIRFISAQSRNVNSGLPSSFTWIDKYKMTSSSNPFADDIFDPFHNPSHQPQTSDGGYQ